MTNSAQSIKPNLKSWLQGQCNWNHLKYKLKQCSSAWFSKQRWLKRRWKKQRRKSVSWNKSLKQPKIRNRLLPWRSKRATAWITRYNKKTYSFLKGCRKLNLLTRKQDKIKYSQLIAQLLTTRRICKRSNLKFHRWGSSLSQSNKTVSRKLDSKCWLKCKTCSRLFYRNRFSSGI